MPVERNERPLPASSWKAFGDVLAQPFLLGYLEDSTPDKAQREGKQRDVPSRVIKRKPIRMAPLVQPEEMKLYQQAEPAKEERRMIILWKED